MTSIPRRKQRQITEPDLTEPLAPVVFDSSKKQSSSASLSAPPPPAEIERLIRETAYFKAEARGFGPGQEVQDWISAEREVRGALRTS